MVGGIAENKSSEIGNEHMERTNLKIELKCVSALAKWNYNLAQNQNLNSGTCNVKIMWHIWLRKNMYQSFRRRYFHKSWTLKTRNVGSFVGFVIRC